MASLGWWNAISIPPVSRKPRAFVSANQRILHIERCSVPSLQDLAALAFRCDADFDAGNLSLIFDPFRVHEQRRPALDGKPQQYRWFTLDDSQRLGGG